jgi:hypothetical protein
MPRLFRLAPASRAGDPESSGRVLRAKAGLLAAIAVSTCFVTVGAVGFTTSNPGERTASATSLALSANFDQHMSAVLTPSATRTPRPSLAPTGDVPSPKPPTSAVPATPPPVARARATTPPEAARPAVTVSRNSLAIPALKINGSVGSTSCGGLIPNGIWRWPCAGTNNFYLLGHAWGVFKPLHDGYHAGLLTPGLVAIYTDAAATAHRYRLAWVEDLTVADWGKGTAWAATSGPVITLQTCDGATDDHRIIARFVPA